MNSTDKTIKAWINSPMVKASQALIDQVLEKTEFIINDGLFEHHKTFAYIGVDGCLYYLEYFGKGWNKRRPNAEGWCKYLNAMAYNVNDGRLSTKREIFS